MLLDVLDDEVRSGKVIDARWTLWVVHCICHVTHQSDISYELHHLPNPNGPAQNTHVKVHSTQDDILNFSLGQKVPSFLTIVGNGISQTSIDEPDWVTKQYRISQPIPAGQRQFLRFRFHVEKC